jgi:outer membrane protein TolC
MKYVLVVMLLLSGSLASARDLSLEQALDLARQHSYQLKASQSEAEAARASLKAAGAERFPTLSATAYATYLSYVPSLNIEIPPAVHLEREVGVHDNYQTDLRLTMPLFTGGKIGGGVDLAKASSEYYSALEKADSQQVDLLARVQYLSLSSADKSLDAARATLKRAEVTVNDIESMYRAGAADSVDLLEVQLARSNAAFAVKGAESNRRSAEIKLAVLLGLRVAEPITLTTSFAEPETEKLSTAVSPDKPQLQAAEAGIMQGRSSLKLAKSDYFPTLAAYGGYSYGKPNLDRFNNTWNHYWTVGANLSWSFNIGGKTVNRAASARHALEASLHVRDNVQEQLSREAELAVEQVKLAYERYTSAKDQYRIAGNNYRLAKQELLHGSMSTNRLLEIEAGLNAAQALLAGAGVDYQIALSQYYFAIGSNKLSEGN